MRFWVLPLAAGHRCCDTRGPRAGGVTSGQAPPVALCWAEAGEPFALVLSSWRHVEHCPGPRVPASARLRPVSPLCPSSRPSGLLAATEAPTSPAAHNGPRPHSRSAPREVAAPPLPRPGPAGACVGGGERSGWYLAGCGTNLAPFPPRRRQAPRPRWL